jgi:hypothetical protein
MCVRVDKSVRRTDSRGCSLPEHVVGFASPNHGVAAASGRNNGDISFRFSVVADAAGSRPRPHKSDSCQSDRNLSAVHRFFQDIGVRMKEYERGQDRETPPACTLTFLPIRAQRQRKKPKEETLETP